MTSPLISVLLPVYNGAPYLAEAIDGILAQSCRDFELIIIDDGSSDGSAGIIAGYDDPRIRPFHQENRGLCASLNRAIGLARGSYLARQDADDVSFPERLARQVDFLERHPDYAMVGSWSRIWEERRPTDRGHRHPCDHVPLAFNLLFDCYFVHSSVMLRRSVLERAGLYPEQGPGKSEDFELWSRILRGGFGKLANLPEQLVAYREVQGSICRSVPVSFAEDVVRICRENLAAVSGRPVADPAIADLAALSHHLYYLVSARPDLREMWGVLRAAALRLNRDGSCPRQVLEKEILIRQARITRAYLLCRWRSLTVRFPWLASGDRGGR